MVMCTRIVCIAHRKCVLAPKIQRLHMTSTDQVVLLSVEQLAHLMHKSPASIRSDASRNLASLPPICRLPGCKRLLWRIEDVREWLAGCVQPSVKEPEQTEAFALSPRKPGRPRKTATKVSA